MVRQTCDDRRFEPFHAGNEGGSSAWYRWTAPHWSQGAAVAPDTVIDTRPASPTGAFKAAFRITPSP